MCARRLSEPIKKTVGTHQTSYRATDSAQIDDHRHNPVSITMSAIWPVQMATLVAPFTLASD
jgi:hypothetical protein